MGEDVERKMKEDQPAEINTTAGAVGLEDVTRSVRALLRSGRSLGTSTLEVAERELAMAISISESIRDDIVTREALERARHQGVMARLRQDGHSVVDLVMDASTIAVYGGLDFLENFADRRRPPLAIDANAARERKE